MILLGCYLFYCVLRVSIYLDYTQGLRLRIWTITQDAEYGQHPQ
jgi:hypothetical protein